MHRTVLTFNGTNNFIRNSAHSDGGVIYANTFHRSQNVFSFIGTNNFINNSAENHGGAIYTSGDAILTFNITNIFISNLARSGGVIYITYDAVLTFIGTNSFLNNSVEYEGGVTMHMHMIVSSSQHTTLCLPSMEITTSSATQHTYVVVQFMHTQYFYLNTFHPKLHLPSMDITTSSITHQYTSMEVQFMHHTMFQLPLMGQTTSLAT